MHIYIYIYICICICIYIYINILSMNYNYFVRKKSHNNTQYRKFIILLKRTFQNMKRICSNKICSFNKVFFQNAILQVYGKTLLHKKCSE